MLDDGLDALLWRRELAGFKRRERLDVKKPGPPFATNNYAFKTLSPPSKSFLRHINGIGEKYCKYNKLYLFRRILFVSLFSSNNYFI